MLSDRRIRTSLLAISTDLFLTVLKVVLAIATGSAALKADAFHSATDFIVSVVLLVGIVIRVRQEKSNASPSHAFSRLVEPGLAVFVAVIILYVPYEIISATGGSTTKKIDNLAIGIFGIIAIILILLFISRFKLFVGRETDSLALEADGYHSMVDVFTSIAVLFSLLGYMVGINLDEIIAVIIAIMISVTGLELLVSGFKSLIKNSEYDQLSFYEFLVGIYRKNLGKYSLSDRLNSLMYSIKRYKVFIVTTGVLVFILSGFSVIPEGEIGKKYRFGAVVPEPTEPGLHYVLPWPFGKFETYQNGTVYAVNFGTRSKELSRGKQRIWNEIKQKSLLSEEANYYVTRDEQLIDMSISVFYKIENINLIMNTISSHEILVQEIASFSFSQFILSSSFDELLSSDRAKLKRELTVKIQNNLNDMVASINVVDVQFQTYRPPALVIGAYRDVVNARQEKLQSINRAVADRSKALPLSRAAYEQSMSNAQSNSSAKVIEAEGDIIKISLLSDVQVSARNGFEFNAYVNVIEDALSNKSIVIKDERLSNSDLRLWNRDGD